jgi:hypothetical protein
MSGRMSSGAGRPALTRGIETNPIFVTVKYTKPARPTGSLNVQVDLDANSDLSLSLLNKNPASGSLFISPPPQQ